MSSRKDLRIKNSKTRRAEGRKGERRMGMEDRKEDGKGRKEGSKEGRKDGRKQGTKEMK